MKYEKVFILLFIFFLCSCSSTRIYSDSESVAETRSNIAELQSGQAESSAAAAEITSGLELISERSSQLGDLISSGTANDIEFAEIIREIYSQPAEKYRKPPGDDRQEHQENTSS